jgi:hypothetical protein
MNLFELFYLYSSVENYCFHSDWLIGFILKNYIQADVKPQEPSVAVAALEAYPSCGNITIATGEPRFCTKESPSCHNVGPQVMEFLALHSYSKSADGYETAPMLSTTTAKEASKIIKQFQEEDAPKKFAYVTVLGFNPDRQVNKMYLDAVRILLASLKSTKVADLVVMMNYDDEVAENLLKSEGAIVKYASRIGYTNDAAEFKPYFVDIALAKLRAFELTEYVRVQVLDADSLVTDIASMDELFTSYDDSKLVAEGLGSDSPLRAGWLMLKPSTDDFIEMQHLLERGVFTSEHGWDNLDLALEYPGWSGLEDNEDASWNFYGSQLEQGMFIKLYLMMSSSLF